MTLVNMMGLNKSYLLIKNLRYHRSIFSLRPGVFAGNYFFSFVPSYNHPLNHHQSKIVNKLFHKKVL
jgi:hypothetical protein